MLRTQFNANETAAGEENYKYRPCQSPRPLVTDGLVSRLKTFVTEAPEGKTRLVTSTSIYDEFIDEQFPLGAFGQGTVPYRLRLTLRQRAKLLIHKAKI